MSDPMDKVTKIAGQMIGKVNEFAESEQVKGAVDSAKSKFDEVANSDQVQGAVGTAKEKLGEIAGKLSGGGSGSPKQ